VLGPKFLYRGRFKSCFVNIVQDESLESDFEITMDGFFLSSAGVLAVTLQAAMLFASPVSAADQSGPSNLSTDQKLPATGPDLEQACPHITEKLKAAGDARRKKQPVIEKVTRPALQRELVLMADADQEARLKWNLANPMPGEVAAVDKHNLVRLKQILHQDGFPTAAMVGYNGVAAAWLLLQHVPDETRLRPRWLRVVAARARSGDLSESDVALMTDRALVSSGKPQRYGSQAFFKDGELVLRPTENPEKLDERRKSIGMMPEADYLCLLRFTTPADPGQTR
jgi:hypothetical protein